MKNFEDLEVWKRSCRLAISIYQLMNSCQDRGLYSQMTRAAVSVPSNIAEGADRRTNKEFVNFLYIAKGSIAELRTQVYLASRLELVKVDEAKKLIKEAKELSSMLQGLITSVKS